MTTALEPMSEQLIKAVRNGNIDRVRSLLERGADPDGRDNNTNTPLIYAVYRSAKLVELLLDKGANINARNKNGMSVLRCCATFYNDNEETVESMNILIERGVSLDETVMEWAEKMSHKEAGKILIAAYERQQRQAREKAAQEAAEASRQRISALHNTAAARQKAINKQRSKVAVVKRKDRSIPH